MKSKFVILFATICLFSVSSSKKETNEKVKGKFVYHKDTLNRKLDQTEESQAMGETENESQAEQKESITKQRIKRHLFEKIRDKLGGGLGGGRPVPIIIINRYGDEDPGNAWGAPRPTKGWHAPPPPTKGWTTPPPTTKGWTTTTAPPPPPTTRGWSAPPPPPANNGWSNLQAQEEDLTGGNSWNVGAYARADTRQGGSGAIRF